MAQKKGNLLYKTVSRLITVIALGVFIYAGYGLVDIFLDYYKNQQLMDSLQETFYDSASAADETFTESMDTDDEFIVRPGFDELLKQNEDVVGWITVDGTKIDYPILQAENNTKYLHHNFYLEESRAGSIFLDYRNDIRLIDEKNIVIYGHRMKDGSMFQHMTKFLDEDFFNKHRTIEFDTLYGHYEAEIFAVYNTLTTFDYIQTYFPDDADFENLLMDIQGFSKFESDVEVTADDQIITLSTCDYVLDQNQGRLVLHAKLIKK